MFGILINVGSNSTNPNGRGRIFEDQTFEYLPIPESEKTRQKVPTYHQLGFVNVEFPDLPVHIDPSFENFTYGHVRRGFGDIGNILRLTEDDVIFFFATLQRGKTWFPFIIGYFRNLKIHDCRRLSTKELFSLKLRGFGDNAHFRRLNPSVDLLIKGGNGSCLLKRAFPLAEDNNQRELRNIFRDDILTLTGKKIKNGTPWFRWVLRSENPNKLIEIIS